MAEAMLKLPPRGLLQGEGVSRETVQPSQGHGGHLDQRQSGHRVGGGADARRVLAKGLAEAKSAFMGRHTNRDMSMVMVANLNWAAPGLLQADFQRLQQS